MMYGKGVPDTAMTAKQLVERIKKLIDDGSLDPNAPILIWKEGFQKKWVEGGILSTFIVSKREMGYKQAVHLCSRLEFDMQDMQENKDAH